MKIFNKMTLPRILSILSILFLASCAFTPEIPEIRLKPGEFGMQINRPSPIISCIAYSPKDRHVAIGKVSGELIIWDISEGRKIWSVEASEKTDKGRHKKAVLSVFFTTDGSHVVSASGGGAVKIWNIESGRLVRTFRGVNDNEFLNTAAITPDGTRILVGGGEDDGTWFSGVLRLWDIESGRVIRELQIPKTRAFEGVATSVQSVAISQDGKLALAAYQSSIKLWNMETGWELRKFEYKKSFSFVPIVERVAFLPDGKHFISQAGEKIGSTAIRLWDIETSETIRTFGGKLPRKPTLSPDGRYVLCGEGEEGIMNLWDLKTGQIVKKFKGKLSFYSFLADEGIVSKDGRRMVSFSPDASIRIWDIESEEEIMMMVAFEDGEWLAITTEGYYNASANGHKYLNVMLGESVYTAGAFYDVFYRPDIVAAKLRGDDISGLVTITMQDAIKSPPPVVEINPIASTINESKVKVCYKAKSTGGGIGEVRLFHNGKLIQSDGFYREVAKTTGEKTQIIALNSRAIYEDIRDLKISGKTEISPITSKSKGESFEDCKEIEAIPGENEVSLTAFNSNNTVQSYMKTITFNSTLKPEDSHLYILSIGIDQYKDNSVNLKYAMKDANDFKEKLLQQSATLYKTQNIHHELLTDKDASKTNILNKIAELAKTIKPTDGFILFVAGHGILLQNQYYMLTHDFNGTVDNNSLISSNEIVEMSKKIKSLNQLFIFDTCHAGGVDYIVSGLYDARMSVLAKKMGLHIYASASSTQQALDGYKGNGLFTYSLLDGLNNKVEADKNNDRKVGLIELGEYTKLTTAEISKNIGHSQIPLIINFGKDNAVYGLR
ncbi:MAG: caspase family protein [Nitrospinae bacterium]|nr:caspase family protein [Nitrospinota bacterium]